MRNSSEEERARGASLHFLFQLGAVLKGVDGGIELVAGSALILWPARIGGWLEALTQEEVRRPGSHQLLIAFLRSITHLSVSNNTFAALYLLIHGVVKLAIVAGLLRGVLWVYPLSLAVLGLLLAYQLYRYLVIPSTWLLVLSIVDIVVIVLIRAELGRLRRLRSCDVTERAG